MVFICKAQTKEFFPSINVTKEITPVVSAITDAVEVTINNNKGKDKESPIKSKKREHKDQIKEDKPAVVVREDKQQQYQQQQLQQHHQHHNQQQQQHKENVAATIAGTNDNVKESSVNVDEKKSNRRDKNDGNKLRNSFTMETNETSSNILPSMGAQETGKFFFNIIKNV